VQKLINSVAHDCLAHLDEEAMHTDAYVLATPRVDEALLAIEPEFSSQLVNKSLLQEAMSKSQVRIAKRGMVYKNTVCFSAHVPTPRFAHSVRL
jgi:proteasome activator subunit 4